MPSQESKNSTSDLEEYFDLIGLRKPNLKVASYTVTVEGFFEKQVELVNKQNGLSCKSIISIEEAKYFNRYNLCMLKLNQCNFSKRITNWEIITFNCCSKRYSAITLESKTLNLALLYLITMNKRSGEIIRYIWIPAQSGFKWTLLDSRSCNKLLIYNACSTKVHTLNQYYIIEEEDLNIFLFTLSIIIVDNKSK
ncbi:hypothetical protein K502DRAFT_350149 [Neoconidiobolus thromboides FSU 785]|nr:hypothetical protein K502DRAFT_350149 [Neoconidiobolus thromboides FSU 785]